MKRGGEYIKKKGARFYGFSLGYFIFYLFFKGVTL